MNIIVIFLLFFFFFSGLNMQNCELFRIAFNSFSLLKYENITMIIHCYHVYLSLLWTVKEEGVYDNLANPRLYCFCISCKLVGQIWSFVAAEDKSLLKVSFISCILFFEYFTKCRLCIGDALW